MKQITFTPRHHQLTNTNTWTPDSQWLVFDVRPSGASFTGKTIERVNVHTGDVEVIYRAVQGAHVGVVTVHPADNHYVFIHGPENPDETWHYDFHHRRGVIATPGGVTNLDAMDITAPYTPGALRGGSHVHVFSPNGELVSFTYNDHVLHERDPALDLRNVGVAVPYGPVTVPVQHPREYSGSHWCVLVSRTTPAPRPGSDDINRAYEEGWVGNRQIAFIGDTLSLTGQKVPELFIVDLPCHENGWKQAGDTPLTGTESTMPSPPLGVVQRRLTFTHQRVYPGLTNEPRHWVRSNPQATAIAFIGDTLSLTGQKVPELFIVDLPCHENGWKQAGDTPLTGTESTMPSPPLGVVQRRLTFTHQRVYPGLTNEPRHWVRSNPQATAIAFLMRDDNGVAQLWLISPQGGEPWQLTHHATGVQSAFNWHPSGKWLGLVLENRIACCDAQSGKIDFLTARHDNPPSADAVVFSPDGRHVAWMEEVKGFRQLWVTETGR
ncbi:DUF3748 domain-containing protein [Salmonella enterica]